MVMVMVVTWYVVNVEITISAREHQSGLPGEGGDGYDVGEAHRGDSDGGPGPGLVESVRHLESSVEVRSGQGSDRQDLPVQEGSWH